jgi:hypothetical protein
LAPPPFPPRLPCQNFLPATPCTTAVSPSMFARRTLGHHFRFYKAQPMPPREPVFAILATHFVYFLRRDSGRVSPSPYSFHSSFPICVLPHIQRSDLASFFLRNWILTTFRTPLLILRPFMAKCDGKTRRLCLR